MKFYKKGVRLLCNKGLFRFQLCYYCLFPDERDDDDNNNNNNDLAGTAHGFFPLSSWKLKLEISDVRQRNHLKICPTLIESLCAAPLYTMMVAFFSRNLSFQCWRKGRCSPNREIVQVRRRRKDTCVLVCLLHSTTETLTVSSPYSLFCLIIDSPVCAFYSSFFPALGSFSHSRWLRVTDGLEKWQKRESGQSGRGRERRWRRFRFQVSFLKFPLNSSVFACRVFLSFLFFFFYSKKEDKKVEKGEKQEASE